MTESRIIELDALKIVGMVTQSGADQPFGDAWRTAWQRLEETEDHPPWLDPPVGWGMCFNQSARLRAGRWSYLAGRQVRSLDAVPVEMVAKQVPPSRYAVFTVVGPVSRLAETFRFVYDTWIPERGHRAVGWDLERYDARYTGADDPRSIVELYIPIDPA